MKHIIVTATLCMFLACPSLLAQNAADNKPGSENADTTNVIATVMQLYQLKEDISANIEKLENTRSKGRQLLLKIENRRDSLSRLSKTMWNKIMELEKTGDDDQMKNAETLRDKVRSMDVQVIRCDKDISYLKKADASANVEWISAKKRLAEIDERIKVVEE